MNKFNNYDRNFKLLMLSYSDKLKLLELLKYFVHV